MGGKTNCQQPGMNRENDRLYIVDAESEIVNCYPSFLLSYYQEFRIVLYFSCVENVAFEDLI